EDVEAAKFGLKAVAEQDLLRGQPTERADVLAQQRVTGQRGGRTEHQLRVLVDRLHQGLAHAPAGTGYGNAQHAVFLPVEGRHGTRSGGRESGLERVDEVLHAV